MDQTLSSHKAFETASEISISNPLQPLDDALNRIFTTQAEETKLQRTRRVMGTVVSETSDEDLEVYITEIQYLIDTWLDEFERQAYGGVTLKQLLQE